MSSDLDKWYQFALQQFGAESYLDGFNLSDRASLIEQLQRGNTKPPFEPSGYTRLPLNAAHQFVDRNEVVAHHGNDATGFSATLLRWQEDGQERYTLSLRSTEFKDPDKGGDWIRDGVGADSAIARTGFALGQLAALEDFFTQSVLPIIGTERIYVTGYSLGGHLATVFTEIHPDQIRGTYLFNGPGRGELVGAEGTSSARLRAMVLYMRSALLNPDDGVIAGLPPSLARGYRSLFEEARSAAQRDPTWNPFAETTAIAYADARYRWAIAATALLFPSKPVPIKRPGLGTQGDGLVTSIYGSALNSDVDITANAMAHSLNKHAVFIEGQPFLEGWGGAKLGGDFGNTHSITLLLDSLALQREFQRLDPGLSQDQIESVLQAASAQKPRTFAVIGEERSVEGDSLEKALFFLRRAIDSSAAEVPSATTPGSFGNIENRQRFFEELAALPAQGDYHIEILTDKPATEIAALASQNDEIGRAVRYALRNLEPFAVVGGNYSAERFANGELDLFDAIEGNGTTEKWIEARARFLDKLVDFNIANGAVTASQIGDYFEDVGLEIKLGAVGSGRRVYKFAKTESDTTLSGSGGSDSLFGSAGNDILLADSGADYAEGGPGNDRIEGGAGDDEIHGEDGDDVLLGGDNNDRIWGDGDDDRLEGGKGNDKLYGGSGFDTYVYSDGDATDTIEDSDGIGQILYKGRALTGGEEKSRNTFVDAAGVRYELSDNGSGPKTLLIDGRIAVENFQSGNLGIVLTDAEMPPLEPPQLSAQRIYRQDPLETSLPYPSDRVPDGLDLDSYLSHWFVSLYGSDGSDSLSILPTDSYTSFNGFYSRGGDDYLKIAVPTAGGDVVAADMGKGNDFVDASLASYSGTNPFEPELKLVGGSGDDYILGGGGKDIIYGDNYRASINTRILPFVAPGTFQFDNFFYNMAGAFPQLMAERAPDASQAAILASSGSMMFRDSPFAESASFGVPHHIWQYEGVEATIRYLELEGWIFSDGIRSVMEYLVGNDASFDDYIDGGGGSDTIIGGNGSDTLYGGAGDDNLDGDGSNFDSVLGSLAFMLGAPGDDFIDGGDGNDNITDTGNSTLIGGAGNDNIQWSSTADANETAFIDGGDGADTITASGAALIEGGAGDDIINANGGADGIAAIYGGDGNDTLSGTDIYVDGGAGDDTYDRVLGTIHDDAGDDTVILNLPSQQGAQDKFLAGWQMPSFFFSPEKRRVYREGDDLVVEWPGNDGTPEATVVEGWFAGPLPPIEHVIAKWADLFLLPILPPPFPPVPVLGPEMTVPIASSELASWGTYQSGTGADDSFEGSEFTDRVLGFEGDDVINTGAGDDWIAGGAGDDYIDGGIGNDAYYYAVGHGNDTIVDGGGFDELRFGQGITASDISATLGSNEITLSVAGSTIRLSAAGNIASGGDLSIDRLVFADESTIALATIVNGAINAQGGVFDDSLSGNAGPNIITGGLGGDYLYGGAGDDTYVFALGDGLDHIFDVPAQGEINTIQFGAGITPDMLSLGTGSLLIRVGSNGDAIHLEDVDSSNIFGTHDIDRLIFADGSELSYAQLLQRGLDLNGSGNADVIVGSDTVDRITGGTGNDVLAGGFGDDLYLYSAGDGQDTIIEPDEADSVDAIHFGLGIDAESLSITRTGDELILGTFSSTVQVTLSGWFSIAPRSIERVEFADGTLWTAAELDARAVASPAVEPSGDSQISSSDAPSPQAAEAFPVPIASPQAPAVLTGPIPADARTTSAPFLTESDVQRIFGNVDTMVDRGNSINSPQGDPYSLSKSSIGGELSPRTIGNATPGKDELPHSGARPGLHDSISGRQPPPLDLQTIEDATRDFESGPSIPRTEDGRQDLEPNKPVDKLDEERGEIIGITRWALTNALMQFHLTRADAEDGIADWRSAPRFGALNMEVAQELIGAPGFGSEAHTLRPFGGLQEGLKILS